MHNLNVKVGVEVFYSET